MALVSPGVEVTIVDQSQYLPAASNSVPFILLATAQDKANASGTAVAPGTLKANANKLYQVTSQRDLVTLFGNPLFYKSADGTPLQGYELNEYGLLATYSLLGTTNTAYVMRADIDLASLQGRLGRPVGAPADGTYWLDTTNSKWGIFEFNASSGKFVEKTPIVISEEANLIGGYPLPSIGNIGDYAVNALHLTGIPEQDVQFFYKGSNNEWLSLASPEWKLDRPVFTATGANPDLTGLEGAVLSISMSGSFIDIVVPNAPNNTVSGIANVINTWGGAGFSGVQAGVNANGQLVFYSGQLGSNKYLQFSDSVSGNLLSLLGIGTGRYYQVETVWGSSAQMPLWTSSQAYPHPTGSVWMKTGAAGNGMNINLYRYNGTTASWDAVTVPLYVSDASAIIGYDGTGGQSVPAGSIYGQYTWGGGVLTAPVYLWERQAEGPTIVTGSTTEPGGWNIGDSLYVKVTVPGSTSLSDTYIVTMSGTDGTSFATDWQAANIPYTTCEVSTSGTIVLTHSEGGDIFLNDYTPGSYVSTGLIINAGFEIDNINMNIKPGYVIPATYSNLSPTGGTGSDAVINVTASLDVYASIVINNGGLNYSLGDVLTVPYTSLGGETVANNLEVVVTRISEVTGSIQGLAYYSGKASPKTSTALTSWVDFDYIANEGAPAVNPANNTNWYYSTPDQVDILVNKNGQWYGYRNVAFDETGHPAATGTPGMTDPNGPIISASEPTTQSDGVTALEYGDLWVDSGDLENYPMIYRWQSVSGVDQWVAIDTTDQISSNGIVFADARWATNGTTDPISDPIPAISTLLTSNYLDLDAPDPQLYPQGMLLWNTRRSSYNVKQYRVNYFNGIDFPDSVLPLYKSTWVTASGLKSDGSPYMGRKAQRAMVVKALKAGIQTNQEIREEDTFFNLIATPAYMELQPDMVTLNNDRHNTAYIVGDTPFRLTDQATTISAWANNTAGATSTGEDGLVTRNEYMGLYYPSGITTDLSGAAVAVPSSHMILRTILRNDQIAYPWFAPAGTRRGTIDNATNIGYISPTTGEFVTIKNRMSIRDVLYTNQINPMAYFTGVGLLNYGNKNSKNTQSALDRTNVARLVAYVRDRLTVLARPFVFEPNDAVTRNQITAIVQSLFVDLIAKRGVYDYLVVCDESNNTPARIDRNELWIDIAMEPVKAAEFIYIPVRIVNTGALT